jgi:alpha-glucosidase
MHDELGLPEAQIAFEDLQDPYGIAMWPEFKGRDGCRTPMPWNSAAADLGFGSASGATTTRPWLPIAESHRALAVDAQDADAASLLNHYRRLLTWRRGHPALIDGEMELLPAHDQVLAYERRSSGPNGERLLCAFNLSDREATFNLPAGRAVAEVLADSGCTGATLRHRDIAFAPWGVLFAHLD